MFCNHGLPLEVISDTGPEFAGKYNQALFDCLRISWNMSTAFHPHTDGQTERMNCTVEDMLRHFVLPLIFFNFFLLGYKGIVHPPSADEGTEQTWFEPEQRPRKRVPKRSL